MWVWLQNVVNRRDKFLEHLYIAKLIGQRIMLRIDDEIIPSTCDGAVLEWQKSQYVHDRNNHFDILSLHKVDRLKHYALHFAKYAGRMARGSEEEKTVIETGVDSLLVSLSAGNTLGQSLRILSAVHGSERETFLDYTSAAGCFCDACEKIDHLEEFLGLAKSSNIKLFNLSLLILNLEFSEIDVLINKRREILKNRQVFI